MLTCKIITTESEAYALAGDWDRLHALSGRHQITSFAFFRAWWENYSIYRGTSLHIVAGHEGERLVALLPLCVTRKMDVRVLRWIGDEPFYDCDLLAEKDAYAGEMWKAARQSPLYDVAYLKYIRPDSPSYFALSPFAHKLETIKSFYLQVIWQSGDAWFGSLKQTMRSEFRRHARRLEEEGELRVEMRRGKDVPPDVIDELISYKDKWFKATGCEFGPFIYPNAFRFFRQIFQTLDERDELIVFWLSIGGKRIAYLLGFEFRDVFHAYMLTHDPAYARHGPGAFIMMKAVCWAIDNGYKGVDLMHGERAYKYKYTNKVTSLLVYTFGKTWRGKLVAVVYMVKSGPIYKKLRSVWAGLKKLLTRWKS